MSASVVIRTRDEARRLRLTLASLEAQAGLTEVVVVDDGSADETPAVVAEAAGALPLVALRTAVSEGRSAASNRGAQAASGTLLILLDGDTLAGPGFVAAHLAAHADRVPRVGRGETRHLRCTRFLNDPETGRFRDEQRAREAGLAAADRDALRVTRAQVRGDFTSVAARARAGIYPGAAPARLHAEEMRALSTPGARRLWAAASGSNLSVPREAFLRAGGFDPALDINEHRELAYRLVAEGASMVAVPAAESFHLTHRAGWRDPLADRGWEARFRDRHPEAPLAELTAWWRVLSGTGDAPDFFGIA